MTTPPISPVTLYGSSISYFTGKLENYFRLKGIAYQLVPLSGPGCRKRVAQETGSTQMPALELGDGRWMSDSTAIIEWFEREYPTPAITPQDPLQRFFSLLLEDYADEWLWRPAMHYRWHYAVGARFASTHLVEELTADIPAPVFLKRWLIIRRQRDGYTTGDGITADQVPAVEAIYLRTLAQLQAIFSRRPFLLGDRPSLADIGFSGPFFRHFGLDPVPAEIMRQQAPAVYEWVARLWNTGTGNAATASGTQELVDGVPADWGPILQEIGDHYLPYLCANVEAISAGQKTFDAQVGGIQYRAARSSKYRVWCLQRLREHYNALPVTVQAQAETLLREHRCWEPLWHAQTLPIGPEVCSGLPFRADEKMLDVYQ